MRPAHPRSRGEHGRRPIAIFAVRGSSPLARGTRGADRGIRRRGRLIPARAGNTTGDYRISFDNAAHPRSRGEHAGTDASAASRAGSSPLARGTQERYCEQIARRRLIPARAGNTGMRLMDWRRSSAHPRSRGEHPDMSKPAPTLYGSSPLARGTRNGVSFCRMNIRLIPARAGNTKTLGDGTTR